MKVKVNELISKLQKCNQNAIVILEKNAGTNSYLPFESLWEGVYSESTKDIGFTSKHRADDEIPAVILESVEIVDWLPSHD